MKRYLLLILFVFATTITSFANQVQHYVVTAKTLNIRSYASTKAHVIGKLHQGDIVKVYIIKNGWAEIEHPKGTAYVNSQYLSKAEIPQVAETEKRYLTDWLMLSSYDADRYATGNAGWMLLPIFLLSVLICVFRKTEFDEVWKVIVFTIAILAVSGFEIAYVLLMGNEIFFFFEIFGWFFNIILFVIIGYLIYNQLACIHFFINFFTEEQTNLKLGLYSALAFLTFTAILIFFNAEDSSLFPLIFMLTIVLQLVQIIKIWSNSNPFIFNLILTVVYIAALVSVSLIIVQYAILIIAIVILLLIVTFFTGTLFGALGSSGSSSSSSSSSSNSTPERTPDWIDAELETDDGRVLRGRMSANEDTFEHGWDVYKKQWDGTYKKT